MVKITTSRSIADVPDIVYYVVSHLDPGSHLEHQDVYTVRRALAQLARTCRNFSLPALKMLWKRLPDDQPLADLLCVLGIAQRHGTPQRPHSGSGTTGLARFEVPIQLNPRILFAASQREAAEHSWKTLRGYDVQYTLSDSSDPSTHPRWKEFEKYASCVQAITLFAFDGPKWCEFWRDLVSCLGPRPLLPNLQSVSLIAISPHELTPSAFLLVSPSVTTLHFAFKHDILSVHAALPLVFDRAPTIETLRLSVAPWEGMHAHCPRVRRISVVPHLNERQLRYLVNFSDLRSLSILLSDTFALTERLALPLLDMLHVKGHWSCLTHLLTATHAPDLRMLSLEAWEPSYLAHGAQQVAQYAVGCFRAISAHHSTLTSLKVCTSYGSTPLPGGCVARSIPVVQDTFEESILDIARPLLALHDLRTLVLILPDYLALDCSSEDLCAISEAWREIEELHVEPWKYFVPTWMTPREERPRGGPLCALSHFARNCPRLRTLHPPPMDAIGMGDEPLESGHPAHPLERLILSKVKISPDDDSDLGIHLSSESAVEFVGRVFPKATWAFREKHIAIADGWLVAHENATCVASAKLNSSVSSISSLTVTSSEAPGVSQRRLIIRFPLQ